MSVLISQVYTVAIFINIDYEQCCVCVGTFMICLHTRLHCSCVGVLVVININRKISERPPSYLKFYQNVSGTEIAYFFALPYIMSGPRIVFHVDTPNTGSRFTTLWCC